MFSVQAVVYCAVILTALQKISHLDGLVNLVSLDLSYNRLRKIEGLDNLVALKEIFFVHNKISKIEGLDALVNLEYLELGDNSIKVGCLLLSRIGRY